MDIAKLALVPEQVKPRRYDSSRRKLAAAQTRSSILAAARELFISHSYGTTTVAAIAERAGVAQDTVYAAVGTKPAIFRSLIESALSGRDEPVPGAQRAYADHVRATPRRPVKAGDLRGRGVRNPGSSRTAVRGATGSGERQS